MLNPKIGVVTLGCPKNTTDTEVMLGLLSKEGFEITFDNEEADICLVNTCAFIEDARKESVRTLIGLAAEGKQLVVTGCLAQHYKEDLLKEIPEARALVGTGDVAKIAEVVKAITADSSLRLVQVSDVPNDHDQTVNPRVSLSLSASAYLKIAEGCDHNCSFCIIPILRGRFRSRTIESLVKEAEYLVSAGIRELILISQDSTYYGLDIYGRMALSELLEKLHEIPGLEWIRIMYFYPTEADEKLLRTINDLPKVVKYVDIPLQHSHPEILRKMARPQNPGKTVENIRRLIDGVAIRSTFIVGFPGEEEEHFEHLAKFIEETRFDRLGIFTYSKQEEVPSGHMEGQLPEKVKKLRRKKLMSIQHEISHDLNRARLGRQIDVLVEGFNESKGLYMGRSQWDAPEVDNMVYIKDESKDKVTIGDFVKVEIQEAKPYDLIGIAVD